MINRFYSSQTKTVTFAAFLLAVSTLISGILGLLRDRLLAGRFGAGQNLDIYFSAFRIPDLVYGILIVGGITASFLPVFSEYFKEDKKWSAQSLEFANNVLNCFLILLVLICAVLALLAPWLINFIIPGFSPENKELTVTLSRLMFLSPLFFGLSSIFSGILHYFDRFLVYSLAPILYNLGIIAGILFFVPLFGIFGLAYGVITGAFLHLLIQIPAAINSGYSYKFSCNFKHSGLLKIFKMSVPRIIGSAAYNINLVIITAIASTLAVGSISVFNFSNNLQYFPIGIIGVSFAISSFPAFSRAWSNGQKKEFLESFSSVFRQIVFFIIPISFLMFLLRAQFVRLILGTGRFGWWDTRLTAAGLGIFCLGILAGSLAPLLTRAFFSLKDTKTPVMISVASMIINVIFSFLFIKLLAGGFLRDLAENVLDLQGIGDIRILGLPLALSIASLFQLILLLIFLYIKIGDFKIKEIFKSFIKVLTAGVIMNFFVYFCLRLSAGFVDMQKYWGVLIQAIIACLIGTAVYLLIAGFLKSSEIKTIKLSFLKQFLPVESDQLEK